MGEGAAGRSIVQGMWKTRGNRDCGKIAFAREGRWREPTKNKDLKGGCPVTSDWHFFRRFTFSEMCFSEM